MGVREAISEALGRGVIGVEPMAGGCVAKAWRATLDGGEVIVAKTGSPGLDIEGWMLRYLAERSRVPVPAVLHASADLLVMEHVEHAGGVSAAGEERAAAMFAELHSITAEDYGLERDTLIGPLTQPNGSMANWAEFYAERRILHFGRLAMARGGIDESMMRALERVAGKMDSIVGEAGPASLVHGDAWGGNVLCRDGEVVALIDPAVHYADAEVELAFITLFSTFGEAFFRRYHELRPIREGFFEERKDVYLLYPLLVHAALFGGEYGQQAGRIARQFG